MKRVLVCDDQPALREVLRDALADLRGDLEVIEAGDGKAALGLLSDKAYDLVFLDVEMPQLDGFETLKALRAKESGRRTPVVMVTGMNTEEHIISGWQLDADGYISKPFNLDEIAEAVATHLA
ncbi:MAG: response regulator [Vulcanimicrobiota bacterium]